MLPFFLSHIGEVYTGYVGFFKVWAYCIRPYFKEFYSQNAVLHTHKHFGARSLQAAHNSVRDQSTLNDFFTLWLTLTAGGSQFCSRSIERLTISFLPYDG